MPYSVRRTVYLGDDDASGLIYFGTYFRYMGDADQDYFAELGHPVMGTIRQGATCPVVHAECDYVSATRSGDRVVQTVRIVAGNRASFRCEHEFTDEEGTVLARGAMVRVWVEHPSLKTLPLPEWLRAVGAADSATAAV